MSGFHLVPLRLKFGRSAWGDLQHYRAQRAAFVQDSISLMNSAASSIQTALQNQSTGAATNAAQSAVDRLNALQAAQNSSSTDLQSILSQVGASSSSSTTGSTVNTTA